jgi:hypothetical protein
LRLAEVYRESPDELGERLSAADVAEWEAYWRLTGPPLGERLDLLFAQLAQRLGWWSRPPRLTDLLPDWSGEGRRHLPSPTELNEKIDSWATACGWPEARG